MMNSPRSLRVAVTGTLLALLLGTASAPATDGVEFGLNSFLGNLGHSEIRGNLVKTAPEDRTNYLDAVQELGVNTIRETFMNWSDIEPERGADYRLEPFDDIAGKASERGIEILALFYPVPTWASGEEPTPPDQLFTSMWHLPQREFEPDFRKFVSTMVRRYCGRHPESIPLDVPIRQWIFSNELDIFPTTPDEYAFWLRAFTEEVKKADPEAKVVVMGFANLWSGAEYLKGILASPHIQGPGFPYFDGLTFHCYTSLNAPNKYAMNTFFDYLRGALRAHKLDVPIWLDETGDASEDLQTQAAEDIKLVMHAASCGVTYVGLHGLWDIGENNGWGVLKNTPSGLIPERKPSFTAYKTLIGKIGKNAGVEFLGPGRYRALMPNGEPIYVLWSEGPNREIDGVLCGANRVRVTTLDGQEKNLPLSDIDPNELPAIYETIE